ncbi:MAG: ATP-grasp domain-containing protein [Lachnospiraceae bacterium]|nr:ATP-grasp domain-containing protein [Lachnospiraceae bacterium]
MKKLMILGGSRYAIPVIKKAHELGLYVITCDYLPDNIAHKYSDEFCDISIIEKEKVLTAAKDRKIDGIISFACDPGVVTAAYVAEKMNLPFQGPYDSVCVLQDKGRFRGFLTENDFNCPHAGSYKKIEEALTDIDVYNWPVIVKPTDSAGSKGVTRVENPKGLEKAIQIAIKESHNGEYLVEDFLTFDGYHSSADAFTIDGKLVFICYSDQLFDPEADNPYTPAYIIWPSTMKKKHQNALSSDIQRLMSTLDMKTGIYNIETCVSGDKPYIMEVSPRGGGCKIAELQQMAYGVDLIENEIRMAVGMDVKDIPQSGCDGHWCEMIVHAGRGQSGVLESVTVDEDIKKKYLKVIDLSVKPGDYVYPFTGANRALGDMFFRFSTRDELREIMSKSKEWLHINLI